MNKTELITAVAEKAGLTKKDVEKAVTTRRISVSIAFLGESIPAKSLPESV